MSIDEVTVDGQPAPASTTTASSCASSWPQPSRAATRARDSRSAIAARPAAASTSSGPTTAHPDARCSAGRRGRTRTRATGGPASITPIEKATTRGDLHRPRGHVRAVERRAARAAETPGGKRTRWHYAPRRSRTPPYLVTLVCGPLRRDRGPRAPHRRRRLLLRAAGPRGRRAPQLRPHARDDRLLLRAVRRAATRTALRQVVVTDFIFGGMENTSATTLTDTALLDERAALDHDIDALIVARARAPVVRRPRDLPRLVPGLAQRGLRDLLRVRLARARTRAATRPTSSCSATRSGYLGEAGRYQRPIVCRHYEEPIDLFDRHLYEKGGRVLHMLRHELGDALFWRALGALRRAARAAARSRRATWRAPSRRPRAATSTGSSTSG